MDKIALGNFLADLRNEKNLTQEELAEILNVSSKTISKWECGTSSPDLETLHTLCELYDVSLFELTTLYKRNKNILISKKDLQKIINKDHITKITITKIIAIIIILITISFFTITTIYTITNYNRFQVYEISSDDADFYVDGYLIKNSNKQRLIISKIYFINKISELNNGSFIIYLINRDNTNENDIITYKNSNYDINKLSQIKIDIDISVYNFNVDNLYLKINQFINNENNKTNYIKLNLTKTYANDKLFY